MPRAIWNGSISFGLVTIPVKLYNAVSRKSVSFNQLDERTGSRIKYKKVSAADGSEVPNDQIIRAYEYAKGQYVTISDEEIESVSPKASRSIDIEAVVDLSEIDPVYFDAAFYAAPGDGFEKPYKLLVNALEADGRVAIARFVRNNKQYLAALRPLDGRIQLSTMAYADEMVDPGQIEEFEGLDDVELSDAELTMASQLLGSLEATFEPDTYHDTHREDLVDLLNRKAAGEEIVTEVAEASDDKVVDLLAALEASVAAAKAARSGDADTDAGADEPTPIRRTKKKAGTRKPAKKAAKKKAAAKKKTAAKKAAAPQRKSA